MHALPKNVQYQLYARVFAGSLDNQHTECVIDTQTIAQWQSISATDPTTPSVMHEHLQELMLQLADIDDRQGLIKCVHHIYHVYVSCSVLILSNVCTMQ